MIAASRVLFVVSGALWTAIGLLGPYAMDTATGRRTLFGSPTTDKALFGAAPEVLLATNSNIAAFRQTIVVAIEGLLVGAGVLVVTIAWFGLRQPEPWVLWLLAIVGLAVIPYWWIAFAPYREAGIRLGVLDLPPFIWAPGLLMPLASVIGWIGYWRVT